MLDLLKEIVSVSSDIQSFNVICFNKYIELSLLKGLSNYRILTIDNILSHSWQNTFPSHLLKFVADLGIVLLIVNMVDGKPISIIFRGISAKEFRVLSLPHNLPYRIGLLSSDFKFGDLIVCVEGPFDADIFSSIYPNVVAVMASGLSGFQKQFLMSLTDSIALFYDNDDAGQKSLLKDFRTLSKTVNVYSGRIYPGDKDPGDLWDSYFNSHNPDVARIEFYKSQLDSIFLSKKQKSISGKVITSL